jgi:hypothetical protein
VGKKHEPTVGREGGSNVISVLILTILGPLKGLVYLIILPFAGIIEVAVLSVYRISQVLATIRHRARRSAEAPRWLNR